MKDRLTQSNLLAPYRQTRRRRGGFSGSWDALPQVQAVRRFNAALGARLRRLVTPHLEKAGKRLAATDRAVRRRVESSPHVQGLRVQHKRFRRAYDALPQVQSTRRFKRFLQARPVLRTLLLMALPLVVFLPFCFSDPGQAPDYIYLVADGTAPQVIFGRPTQDADYGILRMSADTSAWDAQLILDKGQQVAIRHGDYSEIVTSRHETVANLLRRLELTPAEDEMVAINIAGEMPIVHISAELHYQRNEITPVAYATKELTNPLAEKGSRTVIRAGQTGTIMDTYDDVYRMGRVVHSDLIDRTDNSSVTEIVEIGTLVKSVPFEDKLAEVHPNHDGSEGGYLVFESGDSMRYSRKVICNTTAYYSGGEKGAAFHTATGHAVGYGIIAADPKVFPYHSRLYVTGYGFSQVEDCGNFRGNKLDVWYATYRECVYWGRRNVAVYVTE